MNEEKHKWLAKSVVRRFLEKKPVAKLDAGIDVISVVHAETRERAIELVRQSVESRYFVDEYHLISIRPYDDFESEVLNGL